jgi:hypothetical protein
MKREWLLNILVFEVFLQHIHVLHLQCVLQHE